MSGGCCSPQESVRAAAAPPGFPAVFVFRSALLRQVNYFCYRRSGTTPRWPGLGSERSQLCASPSLGPLLVALQDRRARRMTPPASLVLRDFRFGSEPIERSVSLEKLLTAYSRHLQFPG